MSNTVSAPLQSSRLLAFTISLLLWLTAASAIQAQSTEMGQPTPVTSNEVTGRITARDIGDSRLTRHFYVLTGTPGDLVLTVESKNLDGDVDLFLSGSLRPLAKVSMYSGELSTSTSKSIYLRQRETIILRVEARTPNDNEGTYRVRFSGGFEAMAAPVVEPETVATADPTPTPTRRDKNTKRVNAVGARIDEPEPVETAQTTPESSTGQPASETSNTPTTTTTDNTATGDTSAASTASTTTAPETPPTPRGRRRRRGGRNVPTTTPQSRARDTQSTADTTQPSTTVTEPVVEAGPKLIIETRDGMRVERYMSTVRRVTVERGQIVVITNDGKITRHPMTNVLRMAIEP